MKILYKQMSDSLLSAHGISDCYYKKITSRRKSEHTKCHHHTGYELHIVLQGQQVYQVNGQTCVLSAGTCLWIAPKIPHTRLHSEVGTEKYSLTFRAPSVSETHRSLPLSPRLQSHLAFIEEESKHPCESSARLIENVVLEMILTALRQMGLQEQTVTVPKEESATLTLAKQYIRDNLERAPSVSEVAAYCNLSSKQLTRIFRHQNGTTPRQYMTACRVRRIEKLLTEGNASLREISEQLSFSSEYYLNAFFKANAGISPGAYQKMQGK